MRNVYFGERRKFKLSSNEPFAEGNYSLIYLLNDGISDSYVGKVLKSSLNAPFGVNNNIFLEELVKETTTAECLRTAGFSVPKHHGVYSLPLGEFGKRFPVMVMDKIDLVPTTELPPEVLSKALEDVRLEKDLAMIMGFSPPGDFDRNILFSKREGMFYMVDFGYWVVNH